MNTNQSGSQAGPWSNTSGAHYGAHEAGQATEQSNGAYPYGNGQNIDQPTGYGFASQWERSNGDHEHSNFDFKNTVSQDFNANFATEVCESAKTGKLTLANSRDGNLVEIWKPEILHRLTHKLPEPELVYQMKKAMKKHRRENYSKQVSDHCTEMLPYGNVEIGPLEHHDSL